MHAIDTPAARTTDPETSHLAAAAITADGTRAAQQQLAAKAVACYPGMTSLELARRTTLCRFVLARRLPECEKAKQVKRGQARTCTVSGRQAATWWRPEDAPQQHLFPTDPACHAPTSPSPTP